MVKEIDRNSFDHEINQEIPVIVEFYSPTCVHCKKMEGVLNEISEEFVDKAVFAKCNIATEDSLKMLYDITAVPTLLYFKNGQEKDRQTGAIHKLIVAETVKKLKGEV